ncbi:MAG: hypothetical protein ACOX0R_02750 [Candidatus Dojkabacteria bacterium]
MLIVIAVIITIITLSLATYQNLQATIRLNEYTNNLEQNIRKAQRDAMLLEKKSNEGWIYGIGIDFGSINNDDTYGQYKVFKWCSGFSDYGDLRTSSLVPNYDPTMPSTVGTGNSEIPKTNFDEIIPGNCGTDGSQQMLKEHILYGDGRVGTGIDANPPKGTIEVNQLSTDTIRNKTVRYVLFESVTGRTFFYNVFGRLLNYNLAETPMTPREDATNFVMRIKPSIGGKGKKITIYNMSGRVIVEANE